MSHDNNGMTALMYAGENNQNPKIVLTLLRAGADAKVKDKKGKTAFDYLKENSDLKDSDAYRALFASQM